ncbi:Uncharacterized protein APZ42_026707 [Daphnia magna]|uniref:Uncharacterized protein n=1 Tax=Daphnia magna TaxID=35525 RepID=A0A162ECU2_9CRUS|nr:Uncharacterized protein APZ42_026707 [Daphnia magna]
MMYIERQLNTFRGKRNVYTYSIGFLSSSGVSDYANDRARAAGEKKEMLNEEQMPESSLYFSRLSYFPLSSHLSPPLQPFPLQLRHVC